MSLLGIFFIYLRRLISPTYYGAVLRLPELKGMLTLQIGLSSSASSQWGGWNTVIEHPVLWEARERAKEAGKAWIVDTAKSTAACSYQWNFDILFKLPVCAPNAHSVGAVKCRSPSWVAGAEVLAASLRQLAGIRKLLLQCGTPVFRMTSCLPPLLRY